jgi:hypothetical protein
MIPNFSQQDLWKDIEKKYPEVLEKFRTWIDQYKVEIGWDLIFKNNSGTGQSVKFHEIPLDLAVGVIERFLKETQVGKKVSEDRLIGWRVAELFQAVQEELGYNKRIKDWQPR